MTTAAPETEMDNVASLDVYNMTSPNNVTSREDGQELFAKLVEQAIVRYVLPVVILIGTVGNVMSIMVLLRPRMRGKSVYLFLLLLAVADTAVLYVSGFKTWIRVVTGFELMNVNDFSCKSVNFLVLFFQHMSAWIVVLVTVDRFVAVWFPLKASSWCNVTRASITTAICAFLFASYSLHFFWTTKINERANGCRVDMRYKKFMFSWFIYLKFITYCLLPFVIILVLNILIVARLRWTPHTLRPGMLGSNPGVSIGLEASTVMMTDGRYTTSSSTVRTANTTPSTSASSSAIALRQRQQSRVTYMLLVVSVAWLVLTTPWSVYTIQIRFHSIDPRTKATQILVRTVCFLLMYLNHAINFLFYCLMGRKFRVELKEMLRSLCPRPARRWAVTSPSMRTTRSNCVELEPLNNAADNNFNNFRSTTRKQQQQQQQFFVGEPANEVDVTTPQSRYVAGDDDLKKDERLVQDAD